MDISSQHYTLLYISENGDPVYKEKKVYETDVEAIAAAKEYNKQHADTMIHKKVAYKCSVCHKWHIGKNHHNLTDKKRDKIKK